MRIVLEPWQFDNLPLDLGQPVWLNHNLYRYTPISGFVSAAYFNYSKHLNRKGCVDVDLTYVITPLRSERFDIVYLKQCQCYIS